MGQFYLHDKIISVYVTERTNGTKWTPALEPLTLLLELDLEAILIVSQYRCPTTGGSDPCGRVGKREPPPTSADV